MKTKIIILLTTLFVLIFSAQALADEKAVAYIIGAETQGYDSVDSILVQLNSDLDLPLGWDWNSVVGDFKILDGITNIPVISINTDGVPALNYLNLFFDPSYHFGPDKNNLKLHYVNYSGIPIITENGNLQNTSTAINIDDGVDPLLVADSLFTNNLNPFLGETGDTLTFGFVSNEALAAIPEAPSVTFNFPQSTKDVPVTVTATMGTDNKHWYVEYIIPATLPYLDGKVSVSASFWDVHANQGTLASTDTGTNGSYVIIKNYDPTTVYVDDDWMSQADVPAGQIWLWDSFNNIQGGVDAVAEGSAAKAVSTVNVNPGTYTENVTVDKSYLSVYATVPAENTIIDGNNSGIVVTITADNVTLTDLRIQNSGSNPLTDAGIALNDVSNCRITYCDVIDNGAAGIVLMNADSNTIDNCELWDNYMSGIVLFASQDNEISLTYVDGTSQPSGTDYGYGIWLESYEIEGTRIYSTRNQIKGNSIWRCVEDGIYFGEMCDSNSVVPYDYGGGSLSPNYIHQNYNNGIYMWKSGSNTVTGNEIYNNTQYGVEMMGSANNSFTNNEVYDNFDGFHIRKSASYASSPNAINENAIYNNTGYGMYAEAGLAVDVNAENNWWGTANGPTHINNTFNVTAQGDSVSDYVDYVPWYDTDMSGSSFWPVELTETTKATGYFSSIQTAIDAASGDISETVSCKAGTYTENVTVNKTLALTGADNSSTFIDGNSNGIVVTVTSNNVTMSGFTVQNSGNNPDTDAGIVVNAVTGCTISGNNVKDNNNAGIVLQGANDNNILNNNVTNNYNAGIALIASSYNTIQGNTANSTQLAGTDNAFGLALESYSGTGSNNNMIVGNTFRYNEKDGIYVAEFCVNDTIHYNTISNNIDNGVQVWGLASGIPNYGLSRITGNTVNDNGSYGIKIKFSDYNMISNSNRIYDNTLGGIQLRSASENTITGNVIVGNEKGVEVSCNNGGSVASKNNTIVYNDIINNTIGLDASDNNGTDVQYPIVNAKYNWWGTVNGPTHAGNTFNVTAQGDSVSDYVDYVPWLDAGYSIGNEFAPIVLWENDYVKGFDRNAIRKDKYSFDDMIGLGSKDARSFYSSIQAAIDAYDDATYDWAWIGCYEGDFTEDFVADKDNVWFEAENTNVTLLGDQKVAANDIWFQYFEFDPQAGIALLLNSSAESIERILIEDCIFTIDESPSVGIYLGGGTTPHILTDILIDGCTFNGPDDKIANPWKIGGSFGDNIGCSINDLVFTGNEVNKCSIPVNLVNENIDGLGVTYNDFYDTDGVIYFWNDSGTAPTGVLSNFIFENNYVPSSNSYGVAIGGASLGGPIFTDANFGTGNRINDNAFEMAGETYGYGAVYMADQYTGLLDASNNWWGDQYGPVNDNNTYTPPAIKGRATVSNRVEFAPWWNDGTNSCTGRGWEPSITASLYAPVRNVTQDTYHSSIQRGVDAASGGDALSCLAGTFKENVTINKAISVAGEDSSTTFVNGNSVGIVVTVTHNDVSLSDLTVTNSGHNPLTDAGVMLYGVNNCSLQRLIVENNNATGIALQYANENLIQHNRINNNVIAGIALVASAHNDIINNYSGYNTDLPVKDNYGYGIVLKENDENTAFSTANNLSYNTLTHNDFNGVYCGQRCDENLIEYNTVTNNGSDGVYLWKSGTNTVSYNTITDNATVGVQLMASQDNTITHNMVSDNNEGFLVRSGNINYGTTSSPSWVEVHSTGNAINYNHIIDNTTDGMTNEDDTFNVDAEKNWWGDKYGPQNANNPWDGTASGSIVSDYIDFAPWWATSTVTDTTEWVVTREETVKGSDISLAVSEFIQIGIDVAIGNYKYVQVADKGSAFVEDLTVPATAPNTIEIFGGAPDKASYPTIKGVATVPATSWPLAAPNIEILGIGTKLYNFTIEAPDYVEGYYSSGIVVGAILVEISNNNFVMNTVANKNDISQAIQTYRDVSCSMLRIHDNTFTDNQVKSYDWGYEGIYINPATNSSIMIQSNTFRGLCIRAITVDNAIASVISNNDIRTSLAPIPEDWSTSGAYQGINLQGALSVVTLSNNIITGSSSSYGFAQGIRIGNEGDTFPTNVIIGGVDNTTANTISNNTYGILCKVAGGIKINYNKIYDNTFGVQNDDTLVKTTLDATYNYWGATDGPSWTFDYGIGSGSGDEVSEYVDFYPWYQDNDLTTPYAATISQYLLSVNPISPYVDNYFDLIVCAADTNGIRDFSSNGLVDFSSNNVALAVPQEQLLVNGFKEIANACISSLTFDAADHLTLYAWDYSTNPPLHYSELTDIVIREMHEPASPTNVVFTDNPDDNGGWILVNYTLSIDDPFYTAVKDTSYGVSYYVVEIDTAIASGVPDWHFLANISCYNNGTGTNNYTAMLPAPASDTAYNFRMASVYNPTKADGFDKNHVSYTENTSKEAAQSVWQSGSAAPMDNLPAYAKMKVFLEGPYAEGVMSDGTQKPLVSPYDGETITELPLPNEQIIDWIYVELRRAATGETVKEANAFLLTDGSIVDVRGNSSLPFFYTTNVEYYMVIHHRNHVDIMSASSQTFGDFASQATTIDLTSLTAAYGGGFADLGNDNYGLYGGDVNNNNSVTIGDAIETYDHRGETGYLIWDYNMNGIVSIGDAISSYDNRGKSTTIPAQAPVDGGHPFDIEIATSNSKEDNTVDLQISNPRVEAGMFKMEIQLRRTSDWPFLVPGIGYDNLLKDADVQFNYNPAGFTGTPSLSNLNTGLDTAEYTTTVSVASNALTLSITGPEPVTTTMYAPALNVWETICTIELTIADEHENSGIVWNESGTGLISAAGFGSGFLVDTYYGTGDITLPVELSTFTALFNPTNDNIELRWETATESDVNGFNIYRSEVKDLARAGRHINFSLINAAGTSSEPHKYTYGDVIADVYTTHYYWLEVVDFSGTSTFHGPIAYTPGDTDGDNTPDLITSTELFGNFPNPAVKSTKIKYQLKGSAIDQNATIKVYNVRGELVKTLQGKNGVATLDTSDMGHGIYFYRLQTKDYTDIKKLIVVK